MSDWYRDFANSGFGTTITKQLGLPPVPGSTMGWSQDFTVLAPPLPPPTL